MKKTKIIVMVMALALLVGALIGIAATATESTTPEIVAKNIRYGEDLKFRIAVDGDALGADKTVTVNFYEADPATDASPVDTATAVYTDTSDKSKYNLDVDHAYIAVSNYGISAIAYGQTFYITAECDGVVSEVLEYSAVEYFLERLYADADSITDIQKKHYENTIAYGSTAQLVTGDTKTNVADYIYVMAQDGKVNGAAGAVAVKGDALTFTYTGAEDVSGLAYWLDPNGDKAAAATVSGTYTPRFADYTFNDLSNNAVITPSTSSGWQKVTWTDGDKDVTKYKNLLINEIPSTGRSQSYSIVDGVLNYTSTGGTRFALSNGNQAGNHTVFETDVTITVPEGATRAIGMEFYKTSVSTALYQMTFTYNAQKGRIESWFKRNNKYDGVTYQDTTHLVTQVAEAGDTTATFTLKVESYYIAATDDTTMVWSINDTPVWILDSRGVDRTSAPSSDAQVSAYQNTDGVYVCKYAFIEDSGTNYTPRAGVFTCVMFNPNSSNDCSMTFDNIIFTTDTANAPTYNTTAK